MCFIFLGGLNWLLGVLSLLDYEMSFVNYEPWDMTIICQITEVSQFFGMCCIIYLTFSQCYISKMNLKLNITLVYRINHKEPMIIPFRVRNLQLYMI